MKITDRTMLGTWVSGVLIFLCVSPAMAEVNFSGKSEKVEAVVEEVKDSVMQDPPMPAIPAAPIVAVKSVQAPTPAKSVKTAPAPLVAAPAKINQEGFEKLTALKNQEQWVAKLEKQLAGEKNQLIEMRGSLSQNFNLDAKKLEAGKYDFDTKSGKFVEKQ